MTIYDIAKEAGVAASTVSRVINSKPGVKEETRQRIQELLDKYDYTPNITARGLVMQSTKLIGILVQDIRVLHHIGCAFIVEQEMAEYGYSCITMGTGPEDGQKADAIRRLEQHRVEGVVLIGSMFQTDEVREAISRYLKNVPVVMINGMISLPNVSCIIADEYQGVRSCSEYLYHGGHTRQAFFFGDRSPSENLKRQGFLDKMKEYGSEEDTVYCFDCGGSSHEDGYLMTKKALREHPEFDGLIYAVDLLAVGGMRAVQESGRSVPDEIAVIGIDNSIYGEISTPKLTSLDNRLQESGRMAVTFLKEGLDGNRAARKLYLNAEIVRREST